VRCILGLGGITQDDAGEPVGTGEVMVGKLGKRSSLVDAHPRVLPAARSRAYSLHVYLTTGQPKTFGSIA
jgi:hypothetical protein